MTPEKVRKIHQIFGIVTAVMIGIVAVCLIVSCVSIYRSGEKPFNPETVGTALGRIAVPGWLCLICAVGGIVLNIALPVKVDRVKAIRDKNAEKPKSMDPQKLWFIRGAVMAVAIGLIILGIHNNGYADVLGKAIRICQECIGIG